jgi:hypothetical protein
MILFYYFITIIIMYYYYVNLTKNQENYIFNIYGFSKRQMPPGWVEWTVLEGQGQTKPASPCQHLYLRVNSGGEEEQEMALGNSSRMSVLPHTESRRESGSLAARARSTVAVT